LPSPSHVYAAPGVYTVRLVANDPATCNVSDTTFRQVVVLGDGTFQLPDTSICAGGTAQIGLQPIAASGITYQWSPPQGLSNSQVANPIASPTATTTYTLSVSNGQCSTSAQQTVTVANGQIDAGADQTICGPNASAFLVATGFGTIDGFQWSSNYAFTDVLNASPEDSTANVVVTGDAWFYVRSTDNACAAVDSIRITVSLADITLLPVEAICLGDTGIISVAGADPGSTFYWYPEEFIVTGQGTFRIFNRAPTSTTFFVDVTSPAGCTWSGSVQQVVSPLNASSILATAVPSVLIGSGTVQLEALPSGLRYFWSPAGLVSNDTVADPTAQVSATTLFTVVVSDGICSKAAQVLVEVRELICADPDIFVPNTFTPNGDGQNDVLFVRGPNIASLEFMVFDRWGEKVFETTDINRGWDGIFEGRPVDPAVFVYHLKALCVDGQSFFTKGNVTVVR